MLKLTPEQEFALWKSDAPDKVDRIVESTIHDAARLTRALSAGTIEASDAFSIAGRTLLKALATFDPKKPGETLINYVALFLRGALATEWRERNPVHYPEDVVLEKVDPLNPPKPLDDGIVDPEFEQIDFNERWKLVQPALARLTEAERRILELHYEAGWDFPKIGELLGVSRAAVQQSHRQALLKIRHYLLEVGLYSALSHV